MYKKKSTMAIATKTEYNEKTQSKLQTHMQTYLYDSCNPTIQSDVKYIFCVFAHQEIMRPSSIKRAFLVVGNTQTGASSYFLAFLRIRPPNILQGKDSH